MKPAGNSTRPAPKNQNKTIGFGLILFLIIAIPIALNLFNPNRQQVSKASKNTITPIVNFSYDTTKAQQTLEKFIKDKLKEEFVPAKIEVKQKLLQSGQLTGMNYHFGANWNAKDNAFNASLNFINNSNNLQDISLLAIISDTNNFVVNATSTTGLIKTYFKTTPETKDFSCGTSDKNISFCESFKISGKGKTGFGIVKTQQNNGTDISLVFSCFFPKNDSYYTKRTSCLIFREKSPKGL